MFEDDKFHELITGEWQFYVHDVLMLSGLICIDLPKWIYGTRVGIFLLLPSVPLSICKVDGPLEAGVAEKRGSSSG